MALVEYTLYLHGVYKEPANLQINHAITPHHLRLIEFFTMKVLLYFAATLATTSAASIRSRQEKIPEPAPESVYLTPEVIKFTGP